MGPIGLSCPCSSSMSSGIAACSAVSQATLVGGNCPGPVGVARGDEWAQWKQVLCVAFVLWWLSMPLPRVRAKMAAPNLWWIEEKSQSALFTKPSNTNSLHFYMCHRKLQPTTVHAHSNSLRLNQGPGSVPAFYASKSSSSCGLLHAHLQLLDSSWALL